MLVPVQPIALAVRSLSLDHGRQKSPLSKSIAVRACAHCKSMAPYPYAESLRVRLCLGEQCAQSVHLALLLARQLVVRHAQVLLTHPEVDPRVCASHLNLLPQLTARSNASQTF